jgi:hypothetical protein
MNASFTISVASSSFLTYCKQNQCSAECHFLNRASICWCSALRIVLFEFRLSKIYKKQASWPCH